MNEGPLCLDCVEKPRFGRVIGTIAAGGEVCGAEPGGCLENVLVLLRHKFRLRECIEGSAQHGHRARRLARAMVILRRMVAMELAMCRSGRSGGAWLVAFG